MIKFIVKQRAVQDPYYAFFKTIHATLERVYDLDRFSFRRYLDKFGISSRWSVINRFDISQGPMIPIIQNELLSKPISKSVLEKSYVNLKQ